VKLVPGIGFTLLAFLPIACFSARAASTAAQSLHRAAGLREAGDFKEAADVLSQALQEPALSDAERAQLEFQREVLKRIKEDYSLSADELFAKLAASLKDANRPEFDRWLAAGRFDGRKIDGQMCYVDVSVRNLFFRYPELRSRRLDDKDDTAEQKGRLEICRQIKEAARKEGSPYVLPHHFTCTMTVSASATAAPAGATIRAWLPIPRMDPFQSDFKLLASSSPVLALAPDTSPIRSACMEQPASTDHPAKFEITYSYTRSGVFFDLNPKAACAPDLSDPELAKYVAEAPHVVFTAKIRKLARQIARSQTNPVLQARAFYDWIAANVKYSFAREYSTLTNISDYCLSHRYGDCGQEALLFITLCRSKGIPARWQSGWNTFPGAKDIHDWTEIYLAPYGWVPVDPWAGVFATRYCTALTDAERHELRDFYFGGLDFFRMSANSDHSMTLDPPKKTMRSDNVDFQRGELEWEGGNIYFDNFSNNLEVQELNLEKAVKATDEHR
jgi:transglutaminase-like putative cysteine protease